MADTKRTTKFFRVAVEGATTDGRKIEKKWLEEAAATYNPTTYGARVNMEHIRGFSDAKPFCAYGDVVALKTETIDLEVGGKTEKRTALFAQIAPTDDLVAVNAKGQKLYTSIEISENFANSGKAYLVGLAVTDSPASLGTEILTFAAQHPDASPFAKRKQAAGNLFSEAAETTIELEPEAPASFGQQLIDFFKTTFGAALPTPEGATGAPKPAPATPPGGGGDLLDKDGKVDLTTLMTQLNGFAAKQEEQRQTAAQTAELTQLRADFAALKTQLEATPDPKFTGRTPASGGSGAVLTDC